MIRMIQRRLIIPRGDTGSFSIPYLKTISPGDVAVFTIFDIRTKTKMYQKLIVAEGDILNIAFTHGDTVNLKPGKYLWDIKIYTNPQIIDDELVNGDEVDSYYAGFSLPECEIRETGDTLLTSDDAPTSTISPESLNIINAAINEILNTKRAAVEAAETASSKADAAAESAEDASDAAAAASQSAATAEARVNEIESLSVEVNTGLEGTNASVTYTPSTGVLSFIIPRGNTGNGIASCVLNNDFTLTINYTNGDSTTTIPIRGDTPHLTIGEVTEGPHAIATITGTDANPILNLTLPNANVPTKLSQLTDDIGVAGKANSADLATVATSGSYTDLGNKPYIPVKTSDLTNDSNYAVDSNYVHTDNNYTTAEKNKLSGIAAGAEVNVNADWNAASGDAYILNKPTKVSQFTNDAGYLTAETDPTVPTWAKAAQKPLYTAAEVGAPTVAEMNTAIGTAIGNINSFDMAVVQTLPTQDISTHTIYLVPKTGETNDVYDEYVYINNAWEMVGNTQIDLSNYVQKDQYATSNEAGIVKINENQGIQISTSSHELSIKPALSSQIKNGINGFSPITSYKQHESAFYGLAKAAGDTTQSQSDNVVGTYTNEAKTAIQQMLDVPSNSDIPIESGTGIGSVKTKDFEYNNQSYSNVASGYGSVAIGLNTTASGEGSFAEGTGTIAELSAHAEGISTHAKMYGHSEGRFTYAQGVAHAEGQQSEALDIVSHVEGMMTIAANRYAHAEGSMCIAAGSSSHAEGNHSCQTILLSGEANATQYTYSSTQGATIEAGNMILYSHMLVTVTSVENNVITVNTSFEEALSSATAYLYTDYAGFSSHIEGAKTHAPASYAHAQGYDTVAVGSISDVSGQYNVKDTVFPNWEANTAYQIGDKVQFEGNGLECIEANSDATLTIAHWKIINYTAPNAIIVGNGTSKSDRSNAYALDWEGNGHYMGNIYVGANADSTGGAKVLCEADFATAQDIQNIINGGAGA